MAKTGKQDIAVDGTPFRVTGFGHLANVRALGVASPYTVSEGLQIRKATRDEADTLRGLVEKMFPAITQPRNPYETEAVATGDGCQTYADLPESDWRYHVIAFEETGNEFQDFVRASILTQCPLVKGAMLGNTAKGTFVTYHHRHFGKLMDAMRFSDGSFISLGAKELDDLRHVYQMASRIADNEAGRRLHDAIDRTWQVSQGLDHVAFQFLGYMSVLELLLTKSPAPGETASSLTRKVTQKMILVGNRPSVLSIPYALLKNGVAHEKLWKRLYDYRSCIAHGGTPNFKKGTKHKHLKDAMTATTFIRQATSALMRQALEEPELIGDLHDV